jgi:hypothetical protein
VSAKAAWWNCERLAEEQREREALACVTVFKPSFSHTTQVSPAPAASEIRNNESSLTGARW